MTQTVLLGALIVLAGVVLWRKADRIDQRLRRINQRLGKMLGEGR